MRYCAIVIAALLFPHAGEAGTECHYVEYPERFVAVCVGDEPYTPPPSRTAAAAPEAVQEEEVRPSPPETLRGVTTIVLQRGMPEPADTVAEPERRSGSRAVQAVVSAPQGTPQHRTLREPRPGRMTAQRVEAAIARSFQQTRGE